MTDHRAVGRFLLSMAARVAGALACAAGALAALLLTFGLLAFGVPDTLGDAVAAAGLAAATGLLLWGGSALSRW